MLHILEYRAFALTNHKTHAISSSLRSRRVLARESIVPPLSFAKGGHNPYDYYGQRLISARRLISTYPGRERGFNRGLIETVIDSIAITARKSSAASTEKFEAPLNLD